MKFLLWLDTLDRRYIFLLIAMAVIVPLVAQSVFPEEPTPLVEGIFDYIEGMPEGSNILLSCDYDPGSAPELQPMATAIARHCAEKNHKIYFMALWPVGPEMVNYTIREVIEITPTKILEQAAWELDTKVRVVRNAARAVGEGEEPADREKLQALKIAVFLAMEFQKKYPETSKKLSVGEVVTQMEVAVAEEVAAGWVDEIAAAQETDAAIRSLRDRIEAGVESRSHPDMAYGRDYVNLGFKPGNEGVIKVIITDLKKLYNTDFAGTNIDDIEMTRDITSVQDMDLIVNISAGYPGTKEWVQYAAQPYGLDIAAGCTGVQAPLLYPYIPKPLFGLMGAIKGAAEYEAALNRAYPKFADDRLNMGKKRMGPQMVAHLMILLLIIVGNVTFFLTKKGRRAQGGDG